MPDRRIDDQLATLVEAGSAHLVGLVTDDGMPYAARGWGAVCDRSTNRVHVLLATVEVGEAGGPALVGSPIALTATDVRTLVSYQFKGRIERLSELTDADHIVFENYCDDYYRAVMEVDLISRELMERMEPDELIVCDMLVDSVFDQTPGPGAGRAYAGT